MGTFLADLGNVLGMGSGSNAGGNVATSMGMPGSISTTMTNLGDLFKSFRGGTTNMSPMPMPHIQAPTAGTQNPGGIIRGAATGNGQPVAVQQSPLSTSTIPMTQPQGSAPMPNGVPVGTIKGGDLNSVYGVDTGTAATNLYNSESQNSANSTAQAIINANAPNVAQGQANLDTQLAASGIGPSSSVSAIENANYAAQVQQQNTSEIAQVSLEEQKMQQQFLESIMPGAQQHATDTSGWSIFGDVLQGIGDVMAL